MRKKIHGNLMLKQTQAINRERDIGQAVYFSISAQSVRTL